MEDPAREVGPADPDPPHEEAAGPTQRVVQDQIRKDILAIHRDSYGCSAGAAKAYVMDDTVIVILDDLELLPNEEFMIEQGRSDAVKELAGELPAGDQVDIRGRRRAGDEPASRGVASHAQLDGPRFSIEIFRLGRTT